jgi:hypothetical protein
MTGAIPLGAALQYSSKHRKKSHIDNQGASLGMGTRLVLVWNLRGRRVVVRCVSFLLLFLALASSGCHKKLTGGEAAQGQKTFATPDEAAKALVEAARNDNQQQMLEVFGPDSKRIIDSGDAAEDKSAMAGFVEAYDQMNRWRKLDNENQVLVVGATNTAFPVPLRKERKGGWYFDTPAGATELAVRRIGRNELAVIDIMASLADAQEEYYKQAHDGVQQYARKFISDEGKENGLYWPQAAGKPKSPVGPQLAYASEQAAKLKPAAHKPFHGYYFAVLTSQGVWANGGIRDYIRAGVMNRGYAFIAWPADYGKSGVMSFLINRDRIIYQKDLGPKTYDEAPFMTAFAPEGWLRVEQ